MTLNNPGGGCKVLISACFGKDFISFVYCVINRMESRKHRGVHIVYRAAHLISDAPDCVLEAFINRPDADIIGNLYRALKVSPSDLLDVHLTDDELNTHEKKVIRAYRIKEDLQQAVDILLGIDEAASE